MTPAKIIRTTKNGITTMRGARQRRFSMPISDRDHDMLEDLARTANRSMASWVRAAVRDAWTKKGVE